LLCTFCLLNLNNELHFIVLHVGLPHTDTQDSQSGYLTQIPKTASQATSHRYPRQPVRLPHTDTQDSLCSYSLRFRFMVFNATFNNNSVIFWRSFYWWRSVLLLEVSFIGGGQFYWWSKPEYWE
jgi:hypothetical protein